MKKHFSIGFAISGVFIGVLIIVQFKTDIIPTSRFYTTEIQARDDLFKDFLDEQAYLKSKIVSLRKTIEEAQVKIEQQTKDTNLALLDSLKKTLGLTEISGEGVEITLDDGRYSKRANATTEDENLIQASDIRDIVNILNAANAEAISVNKQRVIATSPIVSVGTSILVNNSHIAPPFVISAVGDKDAIIQRLLNNPLLDSLYSRRKKSYIEMEIVIKKSISIPIYNENIETDYLNLVE